LDLEKNLDIVKRKIMKAAAVAGRQLDEITLLAVTKYVKTDDIRELVQLGIKNIGENRIQDALRKQEELFDLKEEINWHFIGSLQTNKARQAVSNFNLIHSLDRFRLAKVLNQQGLNLNKRVPCLIQVNVSGEETKQGIAPEEVMGFYKKVEAMPGIALSGLMTMAPYTKEPEEVRPIFRELRVLFNRIKQEFNPGPEWSELSMGMSNDYEVAIEEGATIVRIGTAIFRPEEG
jgi:hypothetical protein